MVKGACNQVNVENEVNKLKLKYQNPEDFDKISAANNKIEQAQSQLNENITNLVSNQQNLEQLEINAMDVNDTASKFQRGAADLERVMWMRKMKMKIAIGVVMFVLAILFYKAFLG